MNVDVKVAPIMNIPNRLTLFRIALIPVFVLVFYLPFDWARMTAAWLFALAAITDWFDGYLARVLEQQSALGAFLDPVADKLIVVAALIMLVSADPENILLITAVIIITGREITVSALREWMAELGKRSNVAVSFIGKAKTTGQMIAIVFMLYEQNLWGLPIYNLGMLFLVMAATLTLVSMILYLKAAWRDMQGGQE